MIFLWSVFVKILRQQALAVNIQQWSILMKVH